MKNAIYRETLRPGLTFIDSKGNDYLIVQATLELHVVPVGQEATMENAIYLNWLEFKNNFVSWTALPESDFASYNPISQKEALGYAHTVALIENSIQDWSQGNNPKAALEEVQRAIGAAYAAGWSDGFRTQQGG